MHNIVSIPSRKPLGQSIKNPRTFPVINPHHRPGNGQPIFFMYSLDFQIHRKDFVATVMSGSNANYIVTDDTKVLGYIINKVYLNMEKFYA